MLNKQFYRVFKKPKPILGMIHLAGDSSDNKIKRALAEMKIFENCSIDGAIIENYHAGSMKVVEETLKEATKHKLNLVLGVNVLPNEFYVSIPMAAKYGAAFVQLDVIAGKYTAYELPYAEYASIREKHPDVMTLGGVWFKYYTPVEGSNLENDLLEGAKRAEAIVVTGEGTGMETDLEKIKKFRQILGPDKPLIVGAGLTPENAYQQLEIADGAIVGSYLKTDGKTQNPIHSGRVRTLMEVVKKFRK